jgi:hypothetical protein
MEYIKHHLSVVNFIPHTSLLYFRKMEDFGSYGQVCSLGSRQNNSSPGIDVLLFCLKSSYEDNNETRQAGFKIQKLLGIRLMATLRNYQNIISGAICSFQPSDSITTDRAYV